MMNEPNMGGQNPEDWVRRPSLLAASGMYLFAQMGMVILSLLLNLAAYAFPPLAQPMMWMAVSTLLIELLLMGAPSLQYARSHPGAERAYRFNRLGLARGVLIVLMAGVAVVLANNAGSLWIALLQGLGLTVYGSTTPSAANLTELVFQLIFVGALPGICEELMFRGVMLPAFERRGRMYGVVVSAALFALMHGSVSGLPVHFGLGMLMGLMAVRLDSLYAPMVFHIGYNSLAVMLDYALGGSDGSGAAMVNVVGALGAEGMAALVLQTAMSGALMYVLWRMTVSLCPPESPRPQTPDRTRMGWQALLVLLVALLTAGLNYGLDLAHMAGLY